MTHKVTFIRDKKYDARTRTHRLVYDVSAQADVPTTDVTLYTVPAGRTFYLRSFTAANTTADPITVTIRDGPVVKLKLRVPGNTTIAASQLEGYVHLTNVIAVATATGVNLSVGGQQTEIS